ncbi:MAG TPA: hypothetical protein VL051_08165 [Burkholderiaceae bacterium]|nr:hypothetical protein [Burkholderiaceae bacterium]
MAGPIKDWKRLPAGDAEPFPKYATDANDWIAFRAGEFARAAMEPFEAMERLDIEPANEELEE